MSKVSDADFLADLGKQDKPQNTGKPKTLAEAMARLSPKKAKFVSEILSGKNGAEAARTAGWAPVGAATRAWNLQHRDVDVMAAIDVARLEMQQKAEYGLETAMKELDDAILFATTTENATARIRGVELKAKLMGLLVERQDVRNLSAFNIHIAGIDD